MGMPWNIDSEKMLSTWLAYYGAMERLIGILMQLFALALGLPSCSFDQALEGHRSSLRAILYPEVPEADFAAQNGVVVRSGEHTDWGCITVLLADEAVGGLEVKSKDGEWAMVRPVPGGLVVNLGDLLPLWTGGHWVATPHRVIARREDGTCRRRVSIPYLGLVTRATLIKPLLPISSEKSQEAVPITAGEFFDCHEQHVKRSRGELL